MPTGTAYDRAFVAVKNPCLKEAIIRTREELGLPKEGLASVEDARQWYTSEGGSDPDLIGNSPPGPIHSLKPLTDQLSELSVQWHPSNNLIDEAAKELARQHGSLPCWAGSETKSL